MYNYVYLYYYYCPARRHLRSGAPLAAVRAQQNEQSIQHVK